MPVRIRTSLLTYQLIFIIMTVIIYKYPYDQTKALVNMGAKTTKQIHDALRMHKLLSEDEKQQTQVVQTLQRRD